MLNYLCDSCGKKGFLNPESEPKLVEKDGVLIPETRIVRKQNMFTGKMEEVEEAILIYKQERIIRVYLELGPYERITREFCSSCFENVKPKIKEAWLSLESFDPI